MSDTLPSARLNALLDAATKGNPWVIIMLTTDGPVPTLLRDMGAGRPWSSYRHQTASRVLADLVKDPRVIKAEILRARDAIKIFSGSSN